MDIHITFNDPHAALLTILWVVGALVGGYWATKGLIAVTAKPNSPDERMGYAFMAILMAVVAVVALIVSGVLLFIGGAGWAFLACVAAVGSCVSFAKAS